MGYGVVGSASGEGYKNLSHEIVAHDIKFKTSVSILEEVDIVYVCVPTPSTATGECDTSIVESCINELKEASISCPICIKSTIMPGGTKYLSEKYELDLAYVPEFLRERCAYDDFVYNHDLLVR